MSNFNLTTHRIGNKLKQNFCFVKYFTHWNVCSSDHVSALWSQGSNLYKVCTIAQSSVPYHSWFMASWAVSLWSWSTSIKRATRFLAVRENSERKVSKKGFTSLMDDNINMTGLKHQREERKESFPRFEMFPVFLCSNFDVKAPESEISSQYGESNS